MKTLSSDEIKFVSGAGTLAEAVHNTASGSDVPVLRGETQRGNPGNSRERNSIYYRG